MVLPEWVEDGGRSSHLTNTAQTVVGAATRPGQQGDLSTERPPFAGQATGLGHAFVQVAPKQQWGCHAVEHRTAAGR